MDIETSLDVQVLAYVQSGEGFLTAMHDVLRRDGQGRLVVPTFNPVSTPQPDGLLRLVNPSEVEANIRIGGFDDNGRPAGTVVLELPAGASRTLSAQELEQGAGGLTGNIGDGAGSWRLFITANAPIVAMSLLESSSGQLTNLSTLGGAN